MFLRSTFGEQEGIDCGDLIMSVCKKCKKDTGLATYCTLDSVGKHHSFKGKAAILFKDGTKIWYKHGRRHRLDGPAYLGITFGHQWYINGIEYTKADWDEKIGKADKKKSAAIEKKNNNLLFALVIIPVVILGLWVRV